MMILALGALEGILLGLGCALLIDRAINLQGANVAFIILLVLAGGIVGALASTLFVNNTFEMPWTLLAGQTATAVVALLLVLSLFVLAGVDADGRTLALATVWGSMPGAAVGLLFGLGNSGRPSNLDDRPQPHVERLQSSVATPRGRATPSTGAASNAPPPIYTAVQARLQQETAELQNLGFDASLISLDATGQESCLVVKIPQVLGPSYHFYLTCDDGYPARAPSIVVSTADRFSGQERQMPYASAILRQWNPNNTLLEVIEEARRALRLT